MSAEPREFLGEFVIKSAAYIDIREHFYYRLTDKITNRTLLQRFLWRNILDWTIYILECADGSLYTGITKDLPRRIKEHETGAGARYTRGRAPFKLVYREQCCDRSAASKRELEIKGLSRKEKVNLLCIHSLQEL